MNSKLTALALIIGLAGGYTISRYVGLKNIASISKVQCELRTTMRKLWAEHVFWTRNFIISAIADLKDLEVATERLLKNQEDIGAALGSFYGKEAGDKATALLKDHIKIAGELVVAAKAGKDDVVKKTDELWHKNAQDIARLLSSANPQWPYEAMVKMLNDHLALTAQEALLRLQKKWSEDVINYDKIFEQSMEMADHFTTGIVTQFPSKF